MRIRNLAFLAAAILVFTPVLAIAQQDAAGNQNQAAPNAAQGAGAQAAQGAQAADTQAADKPGKAMKEKMKVKMHAAGTCPCPYCPMKDDEAAGTKDVHSQHMRMMMNARITRDDPGVILGMREDLNLTPEQTQQLEQLQAENKQKVEAILTDDQKTQIAKLPVKASSMRDMHQQMAFKMKGDKAGAAEPGAIDKPDEETAARDARKDIMNK